MRITRRSMLTGKTTTRDIAVTEAQLVAWQAGVLIQNAMPHLTDSEREFIMTGCTDEEWDTMVPEEEE